MGSDGNIFENARVSHSSSSVVFWKQEAERSSHVLYLSGFDFMKRTSGDEETGRKYAKSLTLYECLWWGASSPGRKLHVRSEAAAHHHQ